MRCWILGNGPTLPVADLHLLADEPTIGVNYILRSGFVPRCVFWLDRIVDKEPTPDGVLRVSSTGASSADAHVRLRWVNAGKVPVAEDWQPDCAYPSRSSGGAAARWAFSLGFRKIICLGMSGAADEGRDHFYGGQAYAPGTENARALEMFQNDYRRLRESLGDRVVFTDDIRAHL